MRSFIYEKNLLHIADTCHSKNRICTSNANY
jgi:hypothetical protein